jgi:ligand-binding sensor domain-containing protein
MWMRGVFGAIALAFATFAPDARAQVGQWQAHTSFRQVVDLSASPDAIWAATTGGVFRYAPEAGELQRFTPIEGLHNVRVQAIRYSAGCTCVWIGYADGVLDRLDVETGTVETFRDIARATQFSSRAVRRIQEYGDSLLVATDFGLVVFDPERGEVRDTYNQLGAFAPGTAVFDVAVAGVAGGEVSFWLATAEGVAVGPLSSPNLKDPGSWRNETLPGAGPATAISVFEGAVHVGGETAVYRRLDIGAYVEAIRTGNPVTFLRQVYDRLIGVTTFSLASVEAGGGARLLGNAGLTLLRAVTEGPGGAMWVGDEGAALVRARAIDASTTAIDVEAADIYPAGPFDGLFSDLSYAPADGTLWVGGVRGSNVGFYKRSADGTWTNYTSRFYPELVGRRTEFRFVHTDTRNHTWVGSFGGALLEVTPEDEILVHDQSNSSLRRAEAVTDETFIIVGGIHSQADGTVWVTNVDAARPLSVYRPADGWASLASPLSNGLTFGEIFTDSFGQKWIVVIDRRNLRINIGLLVLDTGDTPADASDDAFLYLDEQGSAGQGLPGVFVNAIVEDRDGLVWLGTDEGLAYIVNTGIVARDPNTTPIWPIRSEREEGESQFLLFGLKVNDLAVDPANRLWVATDEGAWLIESDGLGFREVVHFTTENAPLFSDVVVSVEVDPRTGDVYVVTDAGLLSYGSEALAPAEEHRDLDIYPNPAVFAGGASPTIYVEGLVEETEVRVMTAAGDVVRRLDARGGRIGWDGLDARGRPVPSGMYLVVAVGRHGEGAAIGKVAVIR